MKRSRIYLLVISLCFLFVSSEVCGQMEPQEEENVTKQIEELIQYGVVFRYSANADVFFKTDLPEVSTNEEKGYAAILPENVSARLASIGFKLYNVDLMLTHVEKNFRVDTSADVSQTPDNPDDDVGVDIIRFQADTLGIELRKRIWTVLYLLAGFAHTSVKYEFSQDESISGGNYALTQKFENFSAIYGLALGFELIDDVFFSWSVTYNNQLFDRGYFKGSTATSLGIELWSKDK